MSASAMPIISLVFSKRWRGSPPASTESRGEAGGILGKAGTIQLTTFIGKAGTISWRNSLSA